MCGIFGAIGGGIDAETGRRALTTLAHRGPDGEGQHVDREHELYLGHRRLSIIDLSEAGAQPMPNEDGTLWLALNGEIYNHEALRAELEAKGHTFRSRCDAEVVLHLYEEKGIELLHDLHGMFAFALYDANTKRLWLARDRLGIKPLYYYEDPERFAFASELKAIRAVPGLDLSPDPTAWYDYLTYQFVPAPKTIYRRVRKLPAAHYLEYSKERGARVHRWWDVEFKPREDLDGARALEELEALFDTVARDHLVSDVEVGLFLSAGVDSTLVAAATNRVAERPLRAFTIAFPERENDEAEEAAELAKLLGSPHAIGTFSTPEIEACVGDLPDLFDEPFADHASLPMVGLCRHAAAEVKVVLSGDGGDETHLGYGRYLKHGKREELYAKADRVPGLKTLARTGAGRSVPWLRSVAEDPLGRPHAFHLGIPREAKRMILDLPAELEDYDDYWLVREHARPEYSDFARQQYLDLVSLLPDGHLTKVDRVAMRHSLEVRPPLLEHRMVEFAAALPDRLKLDDGEGKPLLRKLLRQILPGVPAAMPKRGFSMPMKHFVRDRGLFRLSGDLDVCGAFRVDRAKAERVFTPQRGSHQLWMLYALELFANAQAAAV